MASQYGRASMDAAADNGACRVRLADIQDQREDPASMGNIGGRPIRATDTVAWLRSGLLSMESSPRIHFADDKADVVLEIDLLKAYMRSSASAKSANVVVRVHYVWQGGTADEQLFRGFDAGVDWAAGTDETHGAFDRALTNMLNELASDIVARCTPAQTDG